MKKSDFIDVSGESAGVSKVITGKSLDKRLGLITRALKKGEDVALRGFGTHKVNDPKARTGRNPKTGETLQISDSKAVVFKVGRSLKHAVQII